MQILLKDKGNKIEIALETWQQIDMTDREWVCFILQIYPYGSVMVEGNCILEHGLNVTGDAKWNGINKDNAIEKAIYYMFHGDVNRAEQWVEYSSRDKKYNDDIKRYIRENMKL